MKRPSRFGVVTMDGRSSRVVYSCNVPNCGRIFTRKSDVERHNREVHDPTQFLCPVISGERHMISFHRPSRLKDHIERSHPQVSCLILNSSQKVTRD